MTTRAPAVLTIYGIMSNNTNWSTWLCVCAWYHPTAYFLSLSLNFKTRSSLPSPPITLDNIIISSSPDHHHNDIIYNHLICPDHYLFLGITIISLSSPTLQCSDIGTGRLATRLHLTRGQNDNHTIEKAKEPKKEKQPLCLAAIRQHCLNRTQSSSLTAASTCHH